MKELDEKLLDSYKNGSFLDVVYKLYLEDHGEESTLNTSLIGMHNEGLLDVISEFNKLRAKDEGKDFFLLRGVLENVLPEINAPTSQVMSCVKHLTLEAGKDMTSHTLMRPFREFCQSDPERPIEVLTLATDIIDEEFDFISSAIISGATIDIQEYVEKAVSLGGSKNSTISQRAIFALGQVDYKDQKKLIGAAVEIIVSAPNAHKDNPFFSVSLRSLSLLAQQDEDCEAALLSFIQNHQEVADDHLIHAAAEILFFERGKIPGEIENSLFLLACKVKPQNKGTLNKLDYAFTNVLKRGESCRVIELIEKLFEQSKYEISIADFSSLVGELFRNKDTYLSELVTRWLLSRNAALGRFCCDLFDISRTREVAIQCDLSQLSGENTNAHLFLTKKACGWLFIKQFSAISFIASLIDSAPEEQLEEISGIVFDPLLISYPGGVKEYLENMPSDSSEKMQNFTASVLEKLDEYHDGLDQVSGIKEMRTSEAQRHAYSRHYHKMMSEMHDGVREESAFLSMIKESVLLYGTNSIHYMYHSGEKHRQESQMQKVSTKFEFPSLELIDPHGLNFQIRRFRLEGCTK
ncbi:hypothetical protein [Leucothrix pacifica]|uniref:Uncharacterized protein n=1 Tax=Leucothrix pacifica TaxID=1247513 RepID=A0A317CSV1_9GAMM|nr:hypothetical protein [Leucothrix pacifica]PWR00604.1 hypothetical protein DKW60_00900 [Leucothrix pacifica]